MKDKEKGRQVTKKNRLVERGLKIRTTLQMLVVAKAAMKSNRGDEQPLCDCPPFPPRPRPPFSGRRRRLRRR